MKRMFALLAIIILPLWMIAQNPTGTPTANLKINNVDVDLNGQKADWEKSCDIQIIDGSETKVVLFEKDGYTFGCTFAYKKGKNRLKLVRRCYAMKSGTEPKYSRKKKDMQEIRTSIPGSMKMRVAENIVVDKNSLEAINVSFNYELIYK